jgi:hypothetical protein
MNEQTQKVPEGTSATPKKEAEGVKFDIPSYGAVKYYNETATPKMVKLVIKISGGAIKEQKQAEYILLGFVVVAIGISLFLVFGKGSKKVSSINIQGVDQSKYVQFNK